MFLCFCILANALHIWQRRKYICIDFNGWKPSSCDDYPPTVEYGFIRQWVHKHWKLGFTVSQVSTWKVSNVCFLLFDIQWNEISVGMISSCLNDSHSCFIDHEMLPIILVFVYQVSSLISTQPLQSFSLPKCFYIQTMITLATREGALSSMGST